eukprot:14174484-Heterocapsa_arctica.AAC.1
MTVQIDAMSGQPLINIIPNKTNLMIMIEDSNIGMTMNEMINNLGTISKSIFKVFMEYIVVGKSGPLWLDPYEIRVDEESKLMLHELLQYYMKLDEKAKNRNFNDQFKTKIEVMNGLENYCFT